MHCSRMRTTCSSPYRGLCPGRGSPRQRPLLDRNLLDKDPLGQRAPTERSPLDRDHLDREPLPERNMGPEDRDFPRRNMGPETETPHRRRNMGQAGSHMIETPFRPHPSWTDRQASLPQTSFAGGKNPMLGQIHLYVLSRYMWISL